MWQRLHIFHALFILHLCFGFHLSKLTIKTDPLTFITTATEPVALSN